MRRYASLLARKPADAIRKSVWGMLPKGPLGRQQLRKLKVYAGSEHPHAAQQPKVLEVSSRAGAGLTGRNSEVHVSKPLIQSTGRRKEAIARVATPSGQRADHHQLPPDRGTYFPTATHRMVVTEPLRLTQTAEVYDVDATLDGGGVTGQAGAMRLGIARALAELDAELRPTLKRAGLLTA